MPHQMNKQRWLNLNKGINNRRSWKKNWKNQSIEVAIHFPHQRRISVLRHRPKNPVGKTTTGMYWCKDWLPMSRNHEKDHISKAKSPVILDTWASLHPLWNPISNLITSLSKFPLVNNGSLVSASNEQKNASKGKLHFAMIYSSVDLPNRPLV